MIERQDFTLYTGKNKTLRIPVVDIDGLPFDLSGWSVKWNLRQEKADGTLVLTKTDPTGITVAGSALSVEILAADTETFPVGRYYHELSASMSDTEYDICNGYVTVKKSGN
jgi:hypothetical protein